MTTARALVLKRWLGGGFCGADGCGGRRFALRGGPVDQADEQDQAERELVDRDVGQEPGDCDIRQGAERRVLAADYSVARPQEVDLHRDAPDKARDVDGHAPASELERRVLLGPSLESR